MRVILLSSRLQNVKENHWHIFYTRHETYRVSFDRTMEYNMKMVKKVIQEEYIILSNNIHHHK